MSTDQEQDAAQIHEFREKQRQTVGDLPALDVADLVRVGKLKPLGDRWYEVPGKLEDLPPGLAALTTETARGTSGRPRIKLGKD